MDIENLLATNLFIKEQNNDWNDNQVTKKIDLLSACLSLL